MNRPTYLCDVSHENAIIGPQSSRGIGVWCTAIYSYSVPSNSFRMNETPRIMVENGDPIAPRAFHCYYFGCHWTRTPSGMCVIFVIATSSDRLIDVYYPLLLISYFIFFYFVMGIGQPCQLLVYYGQCPSVCHIFFAFFSFASNESNRLTARSNHSVLSAHDKNAEIKNLYDIQLSPAYV